MPVDVQKDNSWNVRLRAGKGACEVVIIVNGTKGSETCSIRVFADDVDKTLESISVRDLEELGRLAFHESGLERKRGA